MIVLGLAITATGAWLLVTSGPGEARSPGPQAASTTASTSAPAVAEDSPAPPGETVSPSTASAADPAVTSAASSPGPSAPDVPAVSYPTSLVLGKGAPRTPIVPIGLEASGVLSPPDDPATAGWWVTGPIPGAPGRAIITGHIDSPAGLGAFAQLDRLHPGDALELTTADGIAHTYTVTARQQVTKQALDPALLRGGSRSDLLLVTCIGRFDRRSLTYESNLLITAEPTPSSAQ